MFRYKFYPSPEHFTPSRKVLMVTFCKSVFNLNLLLLRKIVTYITWGNKFTQDNPAKGVFLPRIILRRKNINRVIQQWIILSKVILPRIKVCAERDH